MADGEHRSYVDLSGVWQCRIPGQYAPCTLPGTLDESGIGRPDNVHDQWQLADARAVGLWQEGDAIMTRLTRRYTYTGPAVFTRRLRWAPPAGKRIFLECERARQLALTVNGQAVLPRDAGSLVSPWVFEVTGLLTGDDELALTCDNSYPGWPAAAILRASAASDETQTNWNGVLGYLRLRIEEPAFIEAVHVYPHGDTVDVHVRLDAARPAQSTLRLASPALAAAAELRYDVPAGRSELVQTGLALRGDVRRWDENEGNLYELTAAPDGGEGCTVRFGVRDFAAAGGRLTLNGRPFFVRGEANCAVWPETGHPPMDADSWRRSLRTLRACGVNCVRFHSHCPPEAAFAAADELGLLLQPELSDWDAGDALTAPGSEAYYTAELRGLLAMLANHPSFVMLTLGNELHAGAAGHAAMNRLLALARRLDGTRLYANGSNTHYGEQGTDAASDFYTAMRWHGQDLRAAFDRMQGALNNAYPDLRTDYGPALAALRRESAQPVFSFEVGQYQVLPDFGEIESFHGVTVPRNLQTLQARAAARGLAENWPARVAASGELALLCYRAEVEAALRTEGMSGISLLGLQDFPGQGTALVGMLNSHFAPKPFAFAAPARFAAFFRPVLPLVLLPRFTWTAGERLQAAVRLANHGKTALQGAARWTLCGEGFFREGCFAPVSAPVGILTDLGTLDLPLPAFTEAKRLTLTVTFCGHQNEYPLWVYPDEAPVCPAGVYECCTLDAAALAVLRGGGRVYLAPPSTAEVLPGSVQAQFSSDFWSVACFPAQEGCMGQLIDAAHPLFKHFPTETHTDWQWWPMAGQRAVPVPPGLRPIVTELDSYARLRPLAQLFECRCGGGRLLFSAFGLQDLQQYPEARALQSAVYRYLASDDFAPRQTLDVQTLQALAL